VISKFPEISDAKKRYRGNFSVQMVEALGIMKSLAFDHDKHLSFEAYTSHMSWLRNVGCQPRIDQLWDSIRKTKISEIGDDRLLFEKFLKFWAAASELQFSQAVFTLDDQKYAAARVVEASIEAGQQPRGASKYTDVLVDEFQDIDPLDLRLIQGIVTYHRASLTIVGDDDQTIYEWRGATPEFILQPNESFSRDFKTHILEKNYRCPRNIVHKSRALIEHNRRRVEKNIIPMSEHDAKVSILRRDSFTDSVDEITELALKFKGEGAMAGKRLALIARKRAQLIPYQIIFASTGIPFCAAEDLNIFLSKTFEQLYRVIEVRANYGGRPRSREIIESALLLVDKMNRFELNKSERKSLDAHLASYAPTSWRDVLEALRVYDGPFMKLRGAEARKKMDERCDVISRFLQTETVAESMAVLSEDFAGFEKDYGKARDELFYADPPFFYLTSFSQKYEDGFNRFLDDLDKVINTLAQLPADDDDATNDLWLRPIHLMTALRAKGREFDHVVLLDVNDGIWPSKHAATKERIEAERRVFYVAMTRAKDKLWLTVNGRIGRSPVIPSRFLKEADL
jgi:DNA helicase-2/ATP-dependent DNA helicase PcrA